MELEREVERKLILDHAAKYKINSTEAVKRMEQMALQAACMATRDRQIEEKVKEDERGTTRCDMIELTV